MDLIALMAFFENKAKDLPFSLIKKRFLEVLHAGT
jgi:hypothetical protein